MATKLKTVADKAPKSDVHTLSMDIGGRVKHVIGSFDKESLGNDFDMHVNAAKVAAHNRAHAEGRDVKQITFSLDANSEAE